MLYLREGYVLGWVECLECGYPHLNEGEGKQTKLDSQRCACCDTAICEAEQVASNPLVAWGVSLVGEQLVANRVLPGIDAHSKGRVLSVVASNLIDEGLPTACSTELGASRVLETRLMSAAGVQRLTSAPRPVTGKCCVRVYLSQPILRT